MKQHISKNQTMLRETDKNEKKGHENPRIGFV